MLASGHKTSMHIILKLKTFIDCKAQRDLRKSLSPAPKANCTQKINNSQHTHAELEKKIPIKISICRSTEKRKNNSPSNNNKNTYFLLHS